MRFQLLLTPEAERQLKLLEQAPDKTKRLKAVRKCLGLLESNPRHPGLRTHKFDSLEGQHGEEIFEAYAENKTPAAFRVFWFYGPQKGQIPIVSITPHP